MASRGNNQYFVDCRHCDFKKKEETYEAAQTVRNKHKENCPAKIVKIKTNDFLEKMKATTR